MELIALTGKPQSGKTTLATALEKQGYMLINFTDILKREAVSVLSDYGVDVTVEEMNRDKEKYRGFLQELGARIGFDTNTQWVAKSLNNWSRTLPCVFDNVRTPEQLNVLKGYGFKLVRLESIRSNTIRFNTDVSVGAFGKITVNPAHHPVESALDHVQEDLALSGDLEVEYLVWKVLNS